jgi:hypothetical protein
MRELINIFKDIKSGALPLREVPGFMLWAVSKRLWLVLMMVLAAVVFWRKRERKAHR